MMKEFLARATLRKIDRLSDLITESFRFLLRKQTMVERIHIDPSSFAITLFNEAGHALSGNGYRKARSSIFATTALWGIGLERRLTRCCWPLSTRRWPGSTPLIGSIWSSVYFPAISHQVLILSTYYLRSIGIIVTGVCFKPHIARAYHLNYDEMTRGPRRVRVAVFSGRDANGV